jgi:hypothetical protein
MDESWEFRSLEIRGDILALRDTFSGLGVSGNSSPDLTNWIISNIPTTTFRRGYGTSTIHVSQSFLL